MVPGERPVIYIVYKSNAWKFLYSIVIDNAGITKTGIPYLSKYPDQFINVVICPVSRPLVVSKTSGVNEVDSHKKIKTVWFGTEEVVGYSVGLDAVMFYSWYGNEYY